MISFNLTKLQIVHIGDISDNKLPKLSRKRAIKIMWKLKSYVENGKTF